MAEDPSTPPDDAEAPKAKGADEAPGWSMADLPADKVAKVTIVSTAVLSKARDRAAFGFLLSFTKRTKAGVKPVIVRARTKKYDDTMKIRFPGEAHHEAATRALNLLAHHRPDLVARQVSVHTNFWEVDAVLSKRATRGASTYLAEARTRLKVAAAQHASLFPISWFPKRIEEEREAYERRFRGLHNRLLDLLKAKDPTFNEDRLWANVHLVGRARKTFLKPAVEAGPKRRALQERKASVMEALCYVLHHDMKRSFQEIANALDEDLRTVQQAYNRFPHPRPSKGRHKSGARHSLTLRRSDAYAFPQKNPKKRQPSKDSDEASPDNGAPPPTAPSPAS